MLAETNTIHINKTWTDALPADHAVYIPAALVLLMALDNGWDIAKVRAFENWEPYGEVYLMTLRSNCDGKTQHLIIPKSALVDKILEQRAPVMAHVA